MTEDERDCRTSVVNEGDTDAIKVRVGGHVRCIMGELKGVTGTVVATRTGGRVLIRLAEGLYVEAPSICLRPVDVPGK